MTDQDNLDKALDKLVGAREIKAMSLVSLGSALTLSFDEAEALLAHIETLKSELATQKRALHYFQLAGELIEGVVGPATRKVLRRK